MCGRQGMRGVRKFWYRPHSHHTREQNTASSLVVSTPPTPQSTQALPPSGYFWAQLLPGHSIPMALWLRLQYPHVPSSTLRLHDTHYMLYINTCARVNSALIFLVSCNFNDSTLLCPILTTNIPERVTTASGKLPVRPAVPLRSLFRSVSRWRRGRRHRIYYRAEEAQNPGTTHLGFHLDPHERTTCSKFSVQQLGQDTPSSMKMQLLEVTTCQRRKVLKARAFSWEVWLLWPPEARSRPRRQFLSLWTQAPGTSQGRVPPTPSTGVTPWGRELCQLRPPASLWPWLLRARVSGSAPLRG